MRFPKTASRELLGLGAAEYRTLARLNTPEKIQAFVNDIPQNFEIGGVTCLSVREVLRQKRALCIEGAMVAACALWINGEPPYLMDMKAERDFDHVITLFRRGRHWGAQARRSVSEPRVSVTTPASSDVTMMRPLKSVRPPRPTTTRLVAP